VDDAGVGLPALTNSADLHLHSTASDGALSPAEVVRLARRAGLSAIALTDHDTMAGVPEALEAAAGSDLWVLPGCELSVTAGSGELHLLGYQLAADNAQLGQFLERATAAREGRGREIVARVARCGIAVSFEQVERAAAGAPIGRPHVAKALIASGVTRTIDEAFDRFLGRGRPAYVPKELPTIDQATAVVRAAGGVSILAHPKDRATKPLLENLKARGLDGLEVRHPSHTGPVERELMRLAGELGLLMTGGSDAHGDGAASASHREIGGVRVPMAWAQALAQFAATRRAAGDGA